MSLLLVCLVFLFSPISIFSLSIGSDSSPSRESSVEFPEGVSGNRMNGFASFENGFIYETSDTTCTFDSSFPVSGVVDMKAGELSLSKDLIFDSGTSLNCFGSIYGNLHSIEFGDSVTTLTAYSIPKSSRFVFKDSVDLGRGYSVADWTYDNQYIVSGIGFYKLFLHSFDGSSLTFEDDIKTGGTICAVRAHPSGYYFAVGMLKPFLLDPLRGGRDLGELGELIDTLDELKIYKFSGGVLSLVDSFNVNLHARAVDWSADGNYLVVGLGSDVSVYSFDIGTEACAFVDKLDYGIDEVEHGSISWDQTGEFFVAGTSNGFRIFQFDSVTPDIITKKTTTFGGYDGEAVDWSPTGSWIAVGLSDGTYQLRVYTYDSAGNTLTELESARVNTGVAVESVHWNCDATRLVVGTRLNGLGKELKIYKFDQETGVLTLDNEIEASLNMNSVRWRSDDLYIATGDSAGYLSVYSYEVGDILVDSIFLDDVTLIFNNDMSWKMASTIRGNCTIDGRDNILTLEDTGAITVTSGAVLMLKDLELRGLTSNSFRCASNNASVIFQNCKICLDRDFEFGLGSFLCVGDVIFTGTNKFIYSSTRTSTVSSDSVLTFDSDTTFKYDPAVSENNLLYMTDQSSILYLNGSTLHAAQVGLSLSRGTFVLDNLVTLSCEGNEISLESDLSVKLLADVDVRAYGNLLFC